MIIFDLDGTLLNTIDDLGYACNYALEKAGFPTHPISEYPRMVGNGINNLIRRALPEADRTEETILRVRSHFVPYYDAHNCDYTRPYEGIPELLQTLKSRGHQLAVASNKYQAATEKIVTHFFPGVFDVILGEREGIERKPDPQIVKDILAQLHNDPINDQMVLYIGDSLVDRDTAHNAGVPFIACSWGFVPREKLIEAGVKRIVDRPVEIAKIETYDLLLEQVRSLVSGESDKIANMANVSAVLHEAFGFWWTGFYRVEPNESGVEQLVLGPFQGPVACTRIPFGKGVCGMAWKEAKTIIVPDVHQFAGHIACSSESNSEIVVPVFEADHVTAVLDIDSRDFDTFDQTDRFYLEQIAQILSASF